MSLADERFERLLAQMLEDTAPGLPESLLPEAERAVDATRRWPRLWAALREPPMRQGVTVTVGSVTTRRMAVLAATLLLALLTISAGIAGASLLRGSSIVVDQSGDGDVTRISEAVAMAADGDEILIRPGTYVEAVTVERDISLKGDGPRDRIILVAPEGGPHHRTGSSGFRPYALLLLDVDAIVEGMTLRGEPSQLNIDGGAPIVRDMVIDGVGRPHTNPLGRYTFPDSIVLTDTRATIAGNTVVRGGAITSYEGAPRIVRNTLSGGPSIHAFSAGDDALIADNLVSGTLDRGIGVFGANRMTIEGNTVRDAKGDGISVSQRDDPGNDPVVRDNTVEGTDGPGIYVARGTDPSLIDNRICGNGQDLAAANGRLDEYLAANEVCQRDWSVFVVDPNGKGDAMSITDALEMAADGDVILVRPGAYKESLRVTEDVTLRGDGAVGTVIVTDPGAAHVLTVTRSGPTIAGFLFDGDVLLGEGASATLEENRIAGAVALVGAGHATLLENRLWSVDIDPGSSADVHGNLFDDQRDRGATAIAVEQRHANTAGEHVSVVGNRIQGPYAYGVYVSNGRGLRIEVLDNEVTETDVGLVMRGPGPTTVEANAVRGNAIGIRVGADSVGSSILANVIEANEVGVHVFGAAHPVMSGNHFCGNAENLAAPAASRASLVHDDVCEAASAE